MYSIPNSLEINNKNELLFWIVSFFPPFLPLFNPYPRICLLIFREREGERGRETSTWERNIDQVHTICTPTSDRTHYLGMCPDQKSNLRPFDLWDSAPTNWATQVRASLFWYYTKIYLRQNVVLNKCLFNIWKK